MNIRIAENLRRLRKQNDLTQEKLAEYLGVSYQAISKWERGEGYPDITFLPAIANYFEITLDELLGMNQIRKQKYLADVFTAEHNAISAGKYDEAEKILRDALITFPNEYGLLSDLAMVLSFNDISTENGMASLKEAISLCERVLAGDASEKVRSTTRTALCFLYKDINEHEKAFALGKTLPHFWESREMILPELLVENEYKIQFKESVVKILSVIYDKIQVIECGDSTAKGTKRMVSTGQQSINDLFYTLKAIEKFVDDK